MYSIKIEKRNDDYVGSVIFDDKVIMSAECYEKYDLFKRLNKWIYNILDRL